MKLNLGAKMVLGIVAVSAITYATSAFCLFVIKPRWAPDMQDWLFTSIVLALGIIWTGVLGWVASLMITKPIVFLANAARGAASGNLRITVPERKSEDEIKVLYDSFGAMIEGLRQMIRDINDNALNTQENSKSLSEAIAHVTENIEIMSSVASQIATGVETQTASTQNSMETTEHLLNAFRQIRSEAERMMNLSDTMDTNVQGVKQISGSLVQGMGQLLETNDNSLKMVRRLEQEALEIGAITETVKDIVEQTNLLALNASIEAARSGEDGRGFSVVAGEIRKLAEQSSKSVLGITEIVNRVQVQISETVQLIHGQNELVTEESQTTRSIHDNVEAVTEVISEFVRAVKNIERSIADQTERVEQTHGDMIQILEMTQRFNTGAKQIADSTHEETAVMEEISSSAEELKNSTNVLLNNTKAFQL